MAGIRHPGCATSAADLGRLAAMLNVDQAILDALAYSPASRFAHNRFQSGCLHREMIDISSRRACPACLGEQDHHRTAWDLALLTCCPSHGIRLVGRCHRCGRKLGWTDPGVATCRCGGDLRDTPTIAVTDAERLANGRLLTMAIDQIGEWLPPALRPCDAADLVRLAMCLGMFFTGWTRERRVETLCLGGHDAVAPVVVAGVDGLTRWPTPLLTFLAAERDKASTRAGRFGARKQLGPFYTWLRDLEPLGLRDVLVAAVRQDADPDAVLTRRSHRSRLLNPVTTPSTVVGLVEAARIMGCSQATAKRVLAGHELAGGGSEGRGVPMALDRSLVEQMASENTLNLEQVAHALCISESCTRQMIDRGLLPVLQRPQKGGRARWVIRADAVQDLLGRLEAGCRPVTVGRRLVSFSHAKEALRRVNVDLAGMVTMILEGRLLPGFWDEAVKGLDRLLFDPLALRKLCRSLDEAGVVTIQVAAERLGLKWEVVAHLVRQRILTGTECGINTLEIDRFKAGYVSGAELAREMGTSPRAIARRLAERGIAPASGPDVDGGRQNFFVRRSEIGS